MRYGTQVMGWCYAKSNLLAALLRANGIPGSMLSAAQLFGICRGYLLDVVIEALKIRKNYSEMVGNFPDIENSK